MFCILNVKTIIRCLERFFKEKLMKKIYFYNKKFAFTLAETLIVMGIIGVERKNCESSKNIF